MCAKNKTEHVRLQLSHLDAAAVIDHVVAVSPSGVEELGALHNNLGEMHARAGVYLLGQDVDARTQAKDEACVFPVENDVPAGEQHLSGRRHHHGPVSYAACHFWCVCLVMFRVKHHDELVKAGCVRGLRVRQNESGPKRRYIRAIWRGVAYTGRLAVLAVPGR